jgi:hypothetical protein
MILSDRVTFHMSVTSPMLRLARAEQELLPGRKKPANVIGATN